MTLSVCCCSRLEETETAALIPIGLPHLFPNHFKNESLQIDFIMLGYSGHGRIIIGMGRWGYFRRLFSAIFDQI